MSARRGLVALACALAVDMLAVNTVFALCSIFVGVAVPVYLVDGLPAPHWLIGPLLAANTAPPAHRGRYLAVYQYAFAFANILAPTFFTALYTRGRVLPWLTLAVLATAATVTMYALDGPLKTRENVTV